MAIAYLTDVEGKWEKLRTFLEGNPLFSLRSDWEQWIVDPAPGHPLGRADGIALRPDTHFVFGGDTVDHGPHSLRIVSTLNQLKRRYPDQVTLIAGNRDLNKMRLTAELSESALRTTPPRMQPWLAEQGLRDSAPSRLKWILERTMGAKDAFEQRRAELVTLSGSPRATITDDTVVQSFREEIAPGGTLREFLAHAQLALRIDNTLIVHGAITEENLRTVPDAVDVPDRTAGWVDRWIDGLNRWCRSQVTHWAHGTGDGGEALIRYQGPVPGTRENQASVVYARFNDANGNSLLPHRELVQSLREEQVRRVLCGHTPNGDSPTILRGEGIEIIIADNTFASHASQVEVHSDEVIVRSRYRLLESEAYRPLQLQWRLEDETPLGQRIKGTDGLIKGNLASGDWLVYRVIPTPEIFPGYRVEHSVATPDEIRRRGLSSPFFEVPSSPEIG